MKKLIFATILFCSVTMSAFAKSDDSETKIKVNERDAPDCKNRGGVCLVHMTIGGVSRTYKVCCDDVVVIILPSN